MDWPHTYEQPERPLNIYFGLRSIKILQYLSLMDTASDTRTCPTGCHSCEPNFRPPYHIHPLCFCKRPELTLPMSLLVFRTTHPRMHFIGTTLLPGVRMRVLSSIGIPYSFMLRSCLCWKCAATVWRGHANGLAGQAQVFITRCHHHPTLDWRCGY
jgi:hypothetical protein